MPERDVVALLGHPVSRELGGTHWQYGSSWVRFECAQVVDWYSSPLHPLKASRSSPPGTAATSVASAGAHRCPPVGQESTRQRRTTDPVQPARGGNMAGVRVAHYRLRRST